MTFENDTMWADPAFGNSNYSERFGEELLSM